MVGPCESKENEPTGKWPAWFNQLGLTPIALRCNKIITVENVTLRHVVSFYMSEGDSNEAEPEDSSSSETQNEDPTSKWPAVLIHTFVFM